MISGFFVDLTGSRFGLKNVLSLVMADAKSNAEQLTEFIPVTTMVEVPILSDVEKSEFMASLAKSERDLAEGQFESLSGEEFGAWLSKLSAEVRAKKSKHA